MSHPKENRENMSLSRKAGDESLVLAPLFPSSMLDASIQRFLVEGIRSKINTYLQDRATHGQAAARDTYLVYPMMHEEPTAVNIPNYAFTKDWEKYPGVETEGPYDRQTVCAITFLLQEGRSFFNQTVFPAQELQDRIGTPCLSDYGRGINRLAYQMGARAKEKPYAAMDEIIGLASEISRKGLEHELKNSEELLNDLVKDLGVDKAREHHKYADVMAARARIKGFIAAKALLTELRNYPWIEKAK